MRKIQHDDPSTIRKMYSNLGNPDVTSTVRVSTSPGAEPRRRGSSFTRGGDTNLRHCFTERTGAREQQGRMTLKLFDAMFKTWKGVERFENDHSDLDIFRYCLALFAMAS